LRLKGSFPEFGCFPKRAAILVEKSQVAQRGAFSMRSLGKFIGKADLVPAVHVGSATWRPARMTGRVRYAPSARIRFLGVQSKVMAAYGRKGL